MPPIHPLHAIFLAFPFPLFLGALMSDVAYWKSYHVQWINFSAWLIAGGLLVGAFALLWALIELVRHRATRTRRPAAYPLALLVMWVLGFVNALVSLGDLLHGMGLHPPIKGHLPAYRLKRREGDDRRHWPLL